MKIHSTTLQTRATITTTDKSNAVTIATWMTLVVFVLVFLAREGIKFTMVRKVGLDDVLILLATIFGVGLSVTILILASEGLGVLGPLTVRRADILMKAYYASDFLYISSIGLAKISVIGFFYGIHYRRTQLRFVAAFGIFILGWTIASILVIAFQCGLPRPWDVFTLHCYNKNIFWIVFCIIDMTSDVSIIMLSVNLVAYLKVRLSSKIAVVSCFAPRILVIGASLARLIYIYPVTPHDNPAFNLWTPIICGQVQVCLSIITACIPYMRPFFDLTDSSMWRGDGTRKRVTIDDGSFVGLPTSQVRGHRKFGFGQSIDSTAMASTKTGRTPDVSPRIPSPPPLSPLTTPRVLTPVNTPASIVRNPSNRGLRLHIPSIHVDRATEVSTPQTASSHALSPGCISPNPLLAPSPLSLSQPNPAPPPRAHSHQPVTSGLPGSPVAKTQNQPRFSLFPQPRPRFSLTPQAYTQPMASLTTTRHSRSRSSSRTAVQHMSPNVTPETRTPSPNPLNPQYPPQTSSFQTVAYDDPLRSKAVVMAATAAASAPIPAVHYAHNSTPSYYDQTLPTQTSTFSTPRTMPSYYTRTPPIAPLSRFSPQVPNQYPIEPIAPLAPANSRRRNQRILTPQNSSRSFQMAPNSPVSPPTPLTFWREDDTSDEQETQTAQGVWQSRAVHSMPALKDARNSPQIVVQQF